MTKHESACAAYVPMPEVKTTCLRSTATSRPAAIRPATDQRRRKMTIKKDGGPAFPLKEPLTSDSAGMSLRDYFAAKAMVALITEPKWCDGHTPLVAEIGPKGVLGAGRYASAAYAMADAMLKARKK